jgi:hypothetical protein
VKQTFHKKSQKLVVPKLTATAVQKKVWQKFSHTWCLESLLIFWFFVCISFFIFSTLSCNYSLAQQIMTVIKLNLFVPTTNSNRFYRRVLLQNMTKRFTVKRKYRRMGAVPTTNKHYGIKMMGRMPDLQKWQSIIIWKQIVLRALRLPPTGQRTWGSLAGPWRFFTDFALKNDIF